MGVAAAEEGPGQWLSLLMEDEAAACIPLAAPSLLLFSWLLLPPMNRIVQMSRQWRPKDVSSSMKADPDDDTAAEAAEAGRAGGVDRAGGVSRGPLALLAHASP